MRAFSGKVAMDTYAGRAVARQSNPRDRVTAGKGLGARRLESVDAENLAITARALAGICRWAEQSHKPPP
jgi:hypothetical protein